MNLAKQVIQIILKIILAIVIVVAFFVWIKKDKNFLRVFLNKIENQKITEKKFPQPLEPKEIVFNWKYGEKNYSLSEVFYKSIYDFYNQSPKNFSYTGELPIDWKEKYFQMFTSSLEEKDFIINLVARFRELGTKNNLNDDQLVELIMSFVQAIPYDKEKAKLILADAEGDFVNYPYETLYTQKGVCSDKSFLAYALLREMGYGVALFTYEEENHMAVGIQCPREYSNYDSGYCYAETTAPGNKIGIIPDLSSLDNEAVAPQEIGYFNKDNNNFVTTRQLGNVEIYQISEGKIYNGIIKTIKYIKEIELLRKKIKNLHIEIASLKKHLDANEQELKELHEKIEKFKKNENYDKYNTLIDSYNRLIKTYQKKIDQYNEKVNIYNQNVNKYNKIVKEFSNY